MAWNQEQAQDHCRWLVQTHDNDRYLSSLFAPEKTRGDLWALYAFNFEIARVRELVDEPAAGEVRFKWWEEALDSMYAGRVVDHPVAQSLAMAIDRADLPKHGFFNLIDARRFDLYDDPMPDVRTLEGYLAETSSAIIVLAAWILSGKGAVTVSGAAAHGGLAFGLTGLMRAFPIHRSRGQCYLPLDLLKKRDLEPAHFLAGRYDTAMSVTLSQMRHMARHRLLLAREDLKSVPVSALPAFLHIAFVDDYLHVLGKRDFDPLHTVADISRLKKQWRLMRKSFAEEF